MRQPALPRYTAGVERVVAHLRDCVERPGAPLPDLAELAAVAHLSPFHFHRIYRALTGEAVGQTVARLRLSVAVRALAAGDSVTAAAMAASYDSPQALARVFRARLAVTPASVRGDADAAARLLSRLAAPVPAAAPGETPLRVTIQEVAPFEVVVLRQRGAFEALDRGFGRLFAWALRSGLAERLERLVGVPVSDHRDVAASAHLFDCAMGFDAPRMPAPPPSMSLRTLGGGEYAVLRHVGPYEGLEDALDQLLAGWLPSSGRELRDAPVFHHYLDDPEQVPAAILRADLHVPLAA